MILILITLCSPTAHASNNIAASGQNMQNKSVNISINTHFTDPSVRT